MNRGEEKLVAVCVFNFPSEVIVCVLEAYVEGLQFVYLFVYLYSYLFIYLFKAESYSKKR